MLDNQGDQIMDGEQRGSAVADGRAGAAPDVASEIRSEVSKDEIRKSFQYFE
jgi:predicted AAA+ superfamily ATPase